MLFKKSLNSSCWKKSAALLEKTHKFNELICCVSIFVKKYLWLCWRTRHREPQRLAKLQQLNLCIIYLCTKMVKKSNYTNCIYFDRETISLKWCNLHVSVNYNKNLLFFVWCRKDKFWILFFFKHICAFFSKGECSISICSRNNSRLRIGYWGFYKNYEVT